MEDTKVIKSKTKKIVILNLALILLIAVQIIFLPTVARYVKQESDKIVASYTSLYMSSDGEGKVVSVEDKLGYLNLKLMNYEDSNVTQRDIEYTISRPAKFYNANGEAIENDEIETYLAADPSNQLHVLDVWNQPQVVGRDTYKYIQSIASSDGETKNGNYLFSYEKLNNSAVGKIHNLLIEFKRDRGTDFKGTENVSIIVQLSKPYKEVFIINVKISDKLIVFSNTDALVYETTFQRLYIQSADIFSHYKGTTEILRKYNKRGTKEEQGQYVYIAPRALLVTFKWNNFYFDVNCLKDYHLPNDKIPGINENVSFIDISKPYVSNLDIANKTLVMYVPQGSNFYLDFLIIDDTLLSTVDVRIEVTIIDGGNKSFDIYDEIYGGYNHNVDYSGVKYMNLFKVQ
jgi:hypothetical protein